GLAYPGPISLTPPALRRLRRNNPQDRMGVAGSRRHRRTGQRPGALAPALACAAGQAARRGGERRGLGEPGMRRPVGAWGIFRWPLVIGLVSSAGLVAALLVEGGADLPWTLAIA